ncbi:hypothetical protein GLOIN_2v1789839 [Rhizophagus irregularis DAOM 181602=DAOM 197198]|uniref:Uncharacterized protein n=1 Tax=Rhizophagus irregularis (strain DAOM 181602 / DAOM 197198 / MUCL 43194) TaxID=747089 RepID=A0A2P4P0F7_RHIID|nr:hypothetical protein GLOIN_2v1789839 [Rhizophagus irregularis DAOM 181602=DAOM 197198]POG58870.1 hypothetical protein GLOIN_2v1789839 [Rhizophagus irregularis DAOM 181602=DAOM 197198]GET52679.1 hypothetical protein GLOIN_2v1789839 [Rhizophagus irregularis DAOM 181602=DAOM 197198]|eukprot:XP_025165736.1 hypothetical protein GLOIN_2v1789839 [Rhizophagus irregularis DAOM 181602=DAOM 197198]
MSSANRWIANSALCASSGNQEMAKQLCEGVPAPEQYHLTGTQLKRPANGPHPRPQIWQPKGQKINCKTPVEAVYYSCKRLNTETIYYYCGEKDGLLESNENLIKNYQTIYPFCEVCKEKGYNWPTRRKINAGQKRKRNE